MGADRQEPRLPEGAFERAMRAHLEVTEERVRRLYVRPRALFAEAIVAALVDGTVVEFPAATGDVELPLARRRQPVRIQVKCSGERAPQSPEKIRPPDWGRLTAPKSAKDPSFGVLAAGFNCDVFVFARASRGRRHKARLALLRPAREGGHTRSGLEGERFR
jgi:hypothetical protein